MFKTSYFKEKTAINNDIISDIYKSFMFHVQEGIMFVNRDMKVVSWNKGAERIVGLTAREVVGKYCSEVLKCSDKEGNNLCIELCILEEAILKKQYIDSRVYINNNKGEPVLVWLHSLPVKDYYGNCIGAIQYFFNDTEYEKLECAEKKLKELNEVKNRFLGMAVHDLRNPLTVIMNFCNILLNNKKYELSKDQQFMMQLINKSANKMHLLVEDLLDITAIESGQLLINKKQSNIKEMFELLIASMSIVADQKKIKIILDIDDNLPLISIDKERIDQIFENLIDNAIKFSHPDTTITIKAKKSSDSLLVKVIDQGQGIPLEDQQLLFKPFAKISVKPTGDEKSTGLGLAIVKKVVELHNGIVSCESIVGKGTTFSIKLPL